MKEGTLLKIAILGGTGKEGPGLALRWATNGYPVIIGSRKLEKAQRVADELNQKIGEDVITGLENDNAAQFGDICVLTVVEHAHKEAVESLRDVLKGKILVDATARVDFRDPKPPPSPSAGRIAQNILGPDVRVVAALQNVPAHALQKNLGEQLDFDVLVCADDQQAAEEVIRLIEGADMRGYFAGNLDNAIVVEGLTSILINLNKQYGVRNASVKVTGISNL